jgi:hypothetical protein
MWRIHHNVRQLFMACESWEDGEILLRSQLGLTVQHLVDDCAIQLMLMCPVAAFMGADSDAKPDEERVQHVSAHRQAAANHQYTLQSPHYAKRQWKNSTSCTPPYQS